MCLQEKSDEVMSHHRMDHSGNALVKSKQRHQPSSATVSPPEIGIQEVHS